MIKTVMKEKKQQKQKKTAEPKKDLQSNEVYILGIIIYTM